MVIGRSPECNITVNEQSVSRKHASCTIDGEVSIQDLGSSNGTFVNDNKIDTRDASRWRHSAPWYSFVQIFCSR